MQDLRIENDIGQSELKIIDVSASSLLRDHSNIPSVPHPTPDNTTSESFLKAQPDENIAEKVSKKLCLLKEASANSERNQNPLDSSIASLKEQGSFTSMRKTLQKMHLTVDYVYEEMPEREALFQSSFHRKSC